MKKQVTTPKLRLVFDEPLLTLKLAGGGGGVVESLLGFFGLKFLPLDQFPNTFAQLFLVNEDIF